jgi:uncharacterized RDD family membrane protein YckC
MKEGSHMSNLPISQQQTGVPVTEQNPVLPPESPSHLTGNDTGPGPGPRYLPPIYYSSGNYSQPPGPYPAPPGYPPTQYQSFNYQSNVRGEVAGFRPRVLAMLIDGFIIGIPSSIFYSLFTLVVFGPFLADWNTWGATHYPFSWGSSIIFWGLYAWFCYTFLKGNTLGKSVMGIKLVNPDGSKPTLQTFLLHYTVGYFINGLVLGLGFVWVLFDPYKQTWGQKLFKDSTIRGNW